MKQIRILIGLACFAFLAVASFDEDSVACQEGIESVRESIKGVTFTTSTFYEERRWFKVTFHENETYTLKDAFPSDGAWGKDEKTGRYTLSEKRYSDTGKKYVSVYMENSIFRGSGFSWAFDGDCSVTMDAPSGVFIFMDQGDNNPWED